MRVPETSESIRLILMVNNIVANTTIVLNPNTMATWEENVDYKADQSDFAYDFPSNLYEIWVCHSIHSYILSALERTCLCIVNNRSPQKQSDHQALLANIFSIFAGHSGIPCPNIFLTVSRTSVI